jgi:hypothetical protein
VTEAIEEPLYPDAFGDQSAARKEKVARMREKTREVIQEAIDRERTL